MDKGQKELILCNSNCTKNHLIILLELVCHIIAYNKPVTEQDTNSRGECCAAKL